MSKQINNTGLADKPVIKSSANQADSTDERVLVLAVSNRNDKVVITPFDLESEGDDQTPLSEAEQQLFEKSHAEFTEHKESCEKGLNALLTMFSRRLPREKFASFQNYCFALHDMGISEEKLAQLKLKANRLRLSGFRCQKGGA